MCLEGNKPASYSKNSKISLGLALFQIYIFFFGGGGVFSGSLLLVEILHFKIVCA